MGRLERDIAALADGSYEAPGLRDQIAASPELTALFEEQRRALAATRAASPSAPPQLRAAVSAAARPTLVPRPRPPALGLALATAGVLALAVVALLPSRSSPSVTAVAAFVARAPSGPPPPPDPSHQGTLRRALGGVPYPYWQDAFGLRSSGTRSGKLDGRLATTVYYANAPRTSIAYTIVDGSPLPEPSGASQQVSNGTRFLALTRAGRTIVTWRQAGHTCVISASRLPLGTLLRLAEWHPGARGTQPLPTRLS